jgi:uncharacterized membrane protein
MRKMGGVEDKRALSNLIAYVLLISITISLSVMVYGWLQFYVEGEDVEECPSNVNIVIDSYECDADSKVLSVSLKNRGLFKIDGYVLRYHNRTDAEFGFYVLNDTGIALNPGEGVEESYSFSGAYITLVDVQPFMMDGDKVSCEAYASQKIVCV